MNEKEEEKKEEEKEEEKAETPTNTAPSAEDLEVIKAELEEERKAAAEAKKALAERDKKIAELEATISAVQQAGQTANAELTQLKEAHSKAVSKYLEAVKLANPSIPGYVISGSTIDEIDASLAKAKAIAESIKKSLEAEAKETRVPAGAPPRGGLPLESLSPREKIIAGIQQKQGGA